MSEAAVGLHLQEDATAEDESQLHPLLRPTADPKVRKKALRNLRQIVLDMTLEGKEVSVIARANYITPETVRRIMDTPWFLGKLYKACDASIRRLRPLALSADTRQLKIRLRCAVTLNDIGQAGLQKLGLSICVQFALDYEIEISCREVYFHFVFYS